MSDRQMFTDALEQGLALVAPRIPAAELEQLVDDLVALIGVWEPARNGGPDG